MTICDVAILGAGPAGTVAGTLLARAGMSVVIVDAAEGAQHKIGESLPGFAAELLARHDLPGPVSGAKHQPIGGVISAWGGPPVLQDAINAPGGNDWRLDRAQFERDLRGAAQAAGARLVQTHVQSVRRTGGTWHLMCGAADALAARRVIDASGRRGAVLKSLNIGRQRGPAQSALWAVSKAGAATPTDRTLIETQGPGWWYGAVLPSGAPVAAFHCAPQIAAGLNKNRSEWLKWLAQTQVLAPRLSVGAFAQAAINVCDASGSVARHVAGRDWLACGDAALSFDPVAAQGLLNAINTAIIGAQAILEDAPEPYETAIQRVWAQYCTRHAALYARIAADFAA